MAEGTKIVFGVEKWWLLDAEFTSDLGSGLAWEPLIDEPVSKVIWLEERFRSV